jgi:hypothetical protein
MIQFIGCGSVENSATHAVFPVGNDGFSERKAGATLGPCRGRIALRYQTITMAGVGCSGC